MDYFSGSILPEIFVMKKISIFMMAVMIAAQLTAQTAKQLKPPPPPPVPTVKANKLQPPPPPPKLPAIHKQKVHFIAPKIVKDAAE